MAQPDPELLQSLLLAAEEAGKERKPSVNEVYEPYRTAIQQCLDSGVSVHKIYLLMRDRVDLKCSEAAFQKYIRLTGYRKSRGKFAGMTNEEIEATKRKRSRSLHSGLPLWDKELSAKSSRKKSQHIGKNGSKKPVPPISEHIAKKRGAVQDIGQEENRPRVADDNI